MYWRRLILGVVLLSAGFLACCDTVAVVDPFNGLEIRPLLAPPDSAQRSAMEGVFAVENAVDEFGGQVVVKWNGSWCNLYGEKNGLVAALKCRATAGGYHLEGRAWWNDSDRMLELMLHIRCDEGGDSVALGLRPSTLVIRSTTDSAVLFRRLRSITAPNSFAIIAHRGGFNNSGRFAVPDNSLQMIRTAECFGANGIELDVRVTRDGVPIIFHDDNFTPRLVNGEYVFGPVNGFTFAHIRAFATLKNGEAVPTLREALDEVIARTSIGFVEFDVKNAATLAALFDIQREYHERAKSKGRPLTCYIDLTTEEIATAFIEDKRSKGAACMCELDETWVEKTGAQIWSPRWTLGTLTERATKIKEHNVRFVPWTVNEPEFIDALLREGQADGVLTDVPNIVAYKWYSR